MFKYLWLIILIVIEGITGYHAVVDIIEAIKYRWSLEDSTQAWLLINGILLFVISLAVFVTQAEGGTQP